MFDLRDGYATISASSMDPLLELRSEIYALICQEFGIEGADIEASLNGFHKHITSYSLGEFNKKRVGLIQRISAEVDASGLIFSAFENSITQILGPDILAQKGCNLVLQPPLDPNPSELHRDTPANSPYELVVWVPLVNAYATKAMYILTAEDTKKAFDFLEKSPMEWDEFEKKCKSLSRIGTVEFGKALIFNASLLHGSEINNETETRVSLNIRYKNLFSPSGFKNQLQFFKPIRVSDFSRIGSEVEMRELLR
jgi:sporadic carbohydrate cluster 2OG-Fe(II) oxygenase